VRLNVDVIVAYGHPLTRAAQHATTTIPIVMISADDPVAEGFIAGLARPGGNLTGLDYSLVLELGGTQLELLKAAQLQGLVQWNVAALVIGKPHRLEGQENVLQHCWEAEEARRFIAAAKALGPQPAAFYTLALDSGAHKGELCGLKWSEVDCDAGTVTIVRQLIKVGRVPVFGPLKGGESRTISIAPETAALLRKHKAHQAELKLANRAYYHDHGLVFAKEWEQLRRHGDTLGHPLQMNNIGQHEYLRLIKQAGVHPIKFHGLRHTCATLLQQAGVPIKVVQERLGHKRIEITLNIYAHALPSMQQDAAAKLAALLHP
jgi:integrase